MFSLAALQLYTLSTLQIARGFGFGFVLVRSRVDGFLLMESKQMK